MARRYSGWAAHEASGIWHDELRDAAANLTGFRTAAKLGVAQHTAKTGEPEDKRLEAR